jgi:hypothetical protein
LASGGLKLILDPQHWMGVRCRLPYWDAGTDDGGSLVTVHDRDVARSGVARRLAAKWSTDL